MTKWLIGLAVVVIAVVVAIGLVIALLSAPEASAKGKNQFQLDIVIDTGKGGGVIIREGEKRSASWMRQVP